MYIRFLTSLRIVIKYCHLVVYGKTTNLNSFKTSNCSTHMSNVFAWRAGRGVATLSQTPHESIKARRRFPTRFRVDSVCVFMPSRTWKWGILKSVRVRFGRSFFRRPQNLGPPPNPCLPFPPSSRTYGYCAPNDCYIC